VRRGFVDLEDDLHRARARRALELMLANGIDTNAVVAQPQTSQR
jgi:hypothetical protein